MYPAIVNVRVPYSTCEFCVWIGFTEPTAVLALFQTQMPPWGAQLVLLTSGVVYRQVLPPLIDYGMRDKRGDQQSASAGRNLNRRLFNPSSQSRTEKLWGGKRTRPRLEPCHLILSQQIGPRGLTESERDRIELYSPGRDCVRYLYTI